MFSKPDRKGTSPVDIITIGICMTVLASLAMPYLMQLRSETRRENCANQIRMLALAAHNYAAAYRHFPPATLGFEYAVDHVQWAEQDDSNVFWKHVQNTSSLGLLTPFLELDELYRNVDRLAFGTSITIRNYNEKNSAKISWQGEIDGVENVMTASIDMFHCPEDNLGEVQDLAGIIATQPCLPHDLVEMGSLDACNDIAVQLWPDNTVQLGLTNYVACMGAVGASWNPEDKELRRWRGVMSPRARVRMRDVTDGLSNTLLFGESLGEINDRERRSAMSWLWGGGARVTGYWPIDVKEHPEDAEVPMLGNDKYSCSVGFGSKHEDVVIFAIADGSVREINREIEPVTLRNLAGRADGEIVKDF